MTRTAAAAFAGTTLVVLAGCGGATAPSGASAPSRQKARAAAPEESAAARSSAASADAAEERLLSTIAAQAVDLAPQRDFAAPRRPPVRPIALRFADLPVGHLPAPLPPALAPPSLGAERAASPEISLRVDPALTGGRGSQARVARVVGFSSATLTIGPWSGAAGPEDAGLVVPCGRPTESYGSVEVARWEGLTTDAGGTPRYTVVDGWFALSHCTAFELRRSSAAVREVVPGLVWAFRACGDSCSARQELTLVTRVPGTVLSSEATGARIGTPQQHVAIPVRRGIAETVVLVVPKSRTAPWTNAVVVEAEVGQGVDDPEPIATLFVHALAGPLATADGALLDGE